MNIFKGLAILSVLASPFLSLPASAADVDEQLLTALRDGGNVLVMRHASSPRERPTADTADPGNDNLERQLDDEGKTTATAMGEAMRRLGIRIAGVISSPTFRAIETARLAGLGEPLTYPALGEGGAEMQSASADAVDWLRHEATIIPADPGNVLLITHRPNIVQAFGDAAADVTDGEMLVFRPDGAGGYTLLGRIRIEEWPGIQ